MWGWLLGCSAPVEVRSVAVPMPDGVALAADVIAAPGGEARPTVLIQTRYWRSLATRPAQPAGAMPAQPREPIAQALVDAGYAVVLVDVRGTGASEGVWARPWSAAEVADMGPLLDWIVAQPWSDGRVGATGVSYEGTTALLAASRGHPALRAVLAREVEWDVVDELLAPGGVQNVSFPAAWGRSVAALDRGEVPELFPAAARWFVRGPRPLDDDAGGEALAARMAARRAVDVAADVAGITVGTDRWGDTPAAAVGPAGFAEALARTNARVGVWGSWFDAATADAVLRADAAMPLVDARIGGWNHEGDRLVDPLAAGAPGGTVDLAEVVAFFDQHLADAPPGPPVRRWWVTGAGRWESGDRWPTPRAVTLHLQPGGGLGGTPADLAVDHPVDPTSTTGPTNRWTAGLLLDPSFDDRRAAPGLLSFTVADAHAAGVDQLFGAPQLRCALDVTPAEVSLFVYLEHVGADGRVTLLTEGQTLAGDGDAAVRLRPIAVQLGPGAGLRLSVAGADRGTFAPAPSGGPAQIGLRAPCALELPVR